MKRERDPELAAIGARVREVRLARSMTIEELAEAADTSIQFLSQVERGEQSMTMLKFGHLVKALGVSSDYLLFGRDKSMGRVDIAAEYLGRMNPIERDLTARAVLAIGNLLHEIAPEDD